MNIIFLDWPCFCKEDTIQTLTAIGHSVRLFFHPDYGARRSTAFDTAFDVFCNDGNFDMVFSYNFYPLVAEGCKRNGLEYISIVYDAPHVSLYSYTIVYTCNHVFLFDYAQYQELSNMGISTVHYFPLAGNTNRISQLLAKPHAAERYLSDISFVGSLYNEDHTIFDRMTGLSDYAKGYLDAIMEAQLKVYGCYFIEEVLPENILAEMKATIPYDAGSSGIQTDEYIYGDYVIGRKLTEMDRTRTLTHIAAKYPLRLYTLNRTYDAPGIENMGAVDYDCEMPYVFHYSKINLNITLKSIKSGIPLRAIDIMSAGGFLLTNFQADFLRHFTPDEDFVYYNDLDDLNNKIQYYLNHDEERCRIAKNGQNKIRQFHNFEQHFQDILDFVF